MPKSRTLLVTGATSGVGAAIATHQLRSGASVVATGRSERRLDALAAQAARDGSESRLHIVQADLTRDDDLEALVDAVSNVSGGVVHAVVLAAFGHIGEDEGKAIVDVSSEELNTFIADSILLNFRVARAFLPALKASDGRLLGIVADWGFPQHNVLTSGVSGDATIGSEVFVAAKYALTGFLASIERMNGVTACGLFPGVIASADGECDAGEPRFLTIDASDEQIADAGYEVPDAAIPLSDIAIAVDFMLSTRATARSVLLKPSRHDYDGL